jgi:UDP-glucose 4-epimerase
VATGPLLTRDLVAELLHAKAFDVPPQLPRALVTGTWKLHLQPTDAGWLDMALNAPVMDTGRVESLGWVPAHRTEQVLADFLAALPDGLGSGSPALAPRTTVSGRRATS